MTHFNNNLRLPVRTGPSPMEDAIVQQVEWYMGRLNLEKDDYLKHQMDDDLWVSLDVILNFPKMQRIGVQDKRRVATLLHARSTIVEVDEKTARIRPAWARRSTIVIHDVPANARLDQVATLFQIPSNADLSNASAVPPTPSHPPGLISIQPAADTIWLAIFDSPTGAQDSMHLLLDKEINGQKVNPEVHVENALRPNTEPYRQSEPQHQQSVYRNPRPVDSPQPASGPYPQVTPIISAGMMTNQMLNPMGMPMPVMHHPAQDTHPQYTYAPPPPTSYAAGYPPQNMGVPRQFMGAPRGMHAGYVMTYPQAGHPYDPSHAVPMQPHPVRPQQQQQQQQQVDQNGVPLIPSTPISAEGATASQPPQPVPAVPNGGVAVQTSGETIEGVETATEYVQDGGISQVQADAQRIAAQIPFTAPMQIPVMAGQPIDRQMTMSGQVKPVDMHYLHRTPMMGDPNVFGRGGGRQAGMGRDRNAQRTTDGGMRASGRGSMMDGQRGSAMHRKGKKGNRGSTRHGHGHDRDRRDGKGDGSGSDSGNRDDRRYEKSKPEPNLASMHFPPLPMSENAGTRPALPPKVVKKDDTEDKTPSTASTFEPKETVPIGNDEVPSPDEPRTEVTRSEGETASPAKDASEKEGGPEEPTAETKDSTGEGDRDQVETSTQDSGTSKEDAPPVEVEKKSESKASAAPASSPMSYAAILRSKKPGPQPRPAVQPVSRSSSGASGKNGDSNSGSEASSSSAPQPPKEKSSRRRKSSSQRNNHTGDTKDGSSASIGTKNDKGDKSADRSAGDAPSLTESKDTNFGSSENVRSKTAVENTRTHPVWVNKPKSLFQPASAAPAVRLGAPQVPTDSKKNSSPVSSPGDEKDSSSDRGSMDAVDRNTSNGQPNGTLSTGPTKETGSDVNTNGDVESKDVREVSTSKVVKATSKSAGDGAKGKGSKGPEKTASVSAKGAWAAGGPKAWPKNSGNGVMEKASNTAEF